MPRNFKDHLGAGGASASKKPAAPVTATPPKVGSDDPILPPPHEAANSRKRQVIDIAVAADKFSSLHVLDATKRRIYRDWLNGRDLAVLQILYRDPVLGIPPRRALEHTIREIAIDERRRAHGKVA